MPPLKWKMRKLLLLLFQASTVAAASNEAVCPMVTDAAADGGKLFDFVILTDEYYLDPPPEDEHVLRVEDGLLRKALESLGHSVARKAWTDRDFDWSLAHAVIFRSCWDYQEEYEEWVPFLEKLKEHNVTLVNPRELVTWNMEKEYLEDLVDDEINVVDFVYVNAGSNFTLRQLQEEHGWETMVMKPAFSATSRDTYKVTRENIDFLEVKFHELVHRDSDDMLVQPFQHSVVDRGEVSIIVIGGVISHAILKTPRKGDFRVQDDFGGAVVPYEPTKSEIEFAEDVIEETMEEVGRLPAYARVDIIQDNSGQLALMELEMIEPELFFRFKPEAAFGLALHISSFYSQKKVREQTPHVWEQCPP